MTSPRSTPTPAPEASADAAGGELCPPADPFFDYPLLPYTPRRPAAGKLRSVRLLLESFDLLGVGEEGRRLVAAVSSGLGPFRTVWGIKHGEDGELSWELYFYRRGGGRGEPAPARGFGAPRPGVAGAGVPPPAPPRGVFRFGLPPPGP